MRRPCLLLACLLQALLALDCDGRSRLERSLQRATTYIENRGENLYPMMIPTLHHLRLDYGLKINTAAREHEARQRNKSRRNPFLRELDPETEIGRSDIAHLRGIDRLTAIAMHCDRLGLPKGFLRDLRQLTRQGNYALTHATLALLLAGWRKCLPNDTKFQEELRLQHAELHRQLRDLRPASDLGVETTLMILLAGQHLEAPAAFDTSLLAGIVDGQGADGSWNGDDHTTVLAMWALLEAQKQGLTLGGTKHE